MQPDQSVSMWGAPQSGKTTLLAALYIALNRRADAWKIVGADPQSSDYLIEKTRELSSGRMFPEASQSLERYRWMLIGPGESPPQPQQQNAGWSRKTAKNPPPTPSGARSVTLGLNMIDAPGGWFGTKRAAGADPDGTLLENLSESRGIVFLFDPIREFTVGDSFDHLYGPLTRLAEKMLGHNDPGDGRLPHHLAVCITKFDDPKVLRTAAGMRLIDTDPDDRYGFPRVSSEDARELFAQLCAISASGTADMVLNAIGKYFHEDRIRFFVTSSIGFYVDPRRNVFDWNDFENLLPEEPDQYGNVAYRIRGQIHPINVVEPMLWLGHRLTRQRPRRETAR